MFIIYFGCCEEFKENKKFYCCQYIKPMQCVAMTEFVRCILRTWRTGGGFLVVVRNYTCHVASLDGYVEIGTFNEIILLKRKRISGPQNTIRARSLFRYIFFGGGWIADSKNYFWVLIRKDYDGMIVIW